MNHKTINIFRQNNFIIYSDNKVIIKNNQELKEFYFSDISNVRILKKRNFYPNIILLNILLIIIFTSNLFHYNNGSLSSLFSIFWVSILFISSFFLKNYNYKLLINKGKYGFTEITLQKKNIQNANKFLDYFNSSQILNMYPEKPKNSKFKECI